MSITPGFKEKKKFILLALRRDTDIAGTDYIAAGATPKAILTTGLSVKPLETEQVSRDLDDGRNGGQPVIHTSEMISITAPFELAGSGTASSPAAWSSLIQLSGKDENTEVATEVSHNRIQNASEELDGTIYFYWEGMYHILLAGKASISYAGKINERLMGTAEIKGVYGGTLEGTPPEPDFSEFSDPLPMSNTNTTFTLDGQALNLYEYELNGNEDVQYDEGTERKQIFINDWNEEGKWIIETPTLSTFDPFAIQLSGVIIPFELTHGANEGQVVAQKSTGVQILTVSPAEVKGKQAWDISYRVIRGNDSQLVTR